MPLNVQENKPSKHNKAFYPPMIEIQNIIQQTEAALNSGMLTPLPAVSLLVLKHQMSYIVTIKALYIYSYFHKCYPLLTLLYM